jgi:hypothetical protein
VKEVGEMDWSWGVDRIDPVSLRWWGDIPPSLVLHGLPPSEHEFNPPAFSIPSHRSLHYMPYPTLPPF